MSDEVKPRSWRWVLLPVAVLLVGGLAYLGWRWWPVQGVEGPPDEALSANLRGVGYMERFDFSRAVTEFEEAARLAPGWHVARVNLGIALLNTSEPDNLARAREILGGVLKERPDSPHAHYCLGIIDLHQNNLEEANGHFETVRGIDANDAHTWFYLGLTHPDGKSSAGAKECFERALRLNPYLNAARYNLAQHPVGRDPMRSRGLLAEHKALMDAEWEDLARIAYSEMGPYGEVIGRAPAGLPPEIGPLPMFADWPGFEARLADGTTWAPSEKLDALRRAVRARFGSPIVLLDFDGDGRTDLFLPGAGWRGGRPADLLLRNDGGGKFTDVTSKAGLASASLGCAVADFDNDGRPDLLLTGAGAPQLFRNVGGGRFEEVKVPALAGLSGVFLGAAWVDLDQDGDLDLVLSRYAGSAPEALARLEGRPAKEGGFVELLNVGESPPVEAGKDAPLEPAFRLWEKPAGLPLGGAAVTVAAADLDGDRDLDLLLLADGKAPVGVWNDRLLRFRPAGELGGPANYNGALVLDANHDGRSDVLALPEGKPPVLWLSRRAEKAAGLSGGFEEGAVKGPALLHAQAVDLDRDGWTDVVGLGKQGPEFLQNDGEGKLVRRKGAFGPAEELPSGVVGVAVATLGDGPALLMLVDGKGLRARRAEGNGNHALRLALSGKRGNKKTSVHTNADGVGAWAVAQAGRLWAGQERTTLCAGLGQSCVPLELGIGRHTKADVVRVRWPDGLPQAELGVEAGKVVRITETNRKSTSCPVLFAWDGEGYRFVSDFLGGGALGEMGPDGATRPPRPEESVRLRPGSLAPRGGWYQLKITEPMDEVLYLDRLELVVIDHPAGWLVCPDERFVMEGPAPTQELLFLADARPPERAVDGRGADVLPRVRKRDRRMADDFRVRSWLGYAEEHTLELDFKASGGRQPPGATSRPSWVLCLDGWTDYPYPESIWAAGQAKVGLVPPTLELPIPTGGWKAWGELGFPAGLPRTMTRDVTGLIEQGKGRFRVRSNMQVYWDRVLLARRVPRREAETASRVATLAVGRAVLRHRGLAREVGAGGRGPVTYDPLRNEKVAVSKWEGRLTRTGDVVELLLKRDDCFVVCGPGDEVEVGFDARKLPGPAQGQARTFVLRAVGYSKDSSPFTASGGRVGPLPYWAMKNYPPAGQLPPQQEHYDRRWNTRRAGE